MNKKEYIIKINGISTSVKDVTTLEDALKSLGKTAAKPVKVSASTPGAGGTSKAKALTDEEKAAKKLADTQKKLNAVNSEANRQQIAASAALRDRMREVAREIVVNEQAEGSVIAMGITLNDLRNEYYELSEAERNNIEIGGQMLTKIQALDKEYKAIKESAGQFQESVGNYEKALNGLENLDKGLGDVGSTTSDLSNAFASNSAMMGIFGSVTETTEAAQAELAKVTALVTLAQQISIGVTKEGIIATTAKNALDKITIIQTRARTLAEAQATKGTILATIAQYAFNAVASANPYVLLALALVAVIGALVVFSDETEDAAEDQKALNEQEKIFLDYLDTEAARLKLVSDARVNAFSRQLELAKAQGKSVKETRKLEDEIYREKLLQNARLLGTYAHEVEAIEENRKKLAQYNDLLRQAKLAKERGTDKLIIDIDLNGKAEDVDIEKAIETLQSNIEATGRKVQLGVELKTDEKDLLNEANVTKALREKEDAEAAKAAAEKAKKERDDAKKLRQERAALELEAQRALEDLKAKIAGESIENQRKIITREYMRQVQDIQIRLNNEERLTTKAKKSLNAQIVALDQVMNDELDKLGKEYNRRELETLRSVEDQKTSFILGMEDRRRAEINIAYDRQIEDVQHRLDTEESLTKKQRQALNELVIGYEKEKQIELEALAIEGANKIADIELKTVEFNLASAKTKIGDILKRGKDKYGLATGLIDVAATKKAVKDVNAEYQNYIVGLEFYQVDLRNAHEKTLASLKEGTPEYREELLKYAAANDEVAAKIKAANQSIAENNKTAAEVQVAGIGESIGKVAGFAQAASDAINMVTSTLTMGLQASLDSLNEQLEVVNEQYDAAKEKREKYAEDVANIEAQVQNAQGATSDAMKAQLQDAMHLRDEAAREEQRLQKEKEKKEAEIKKKEKQMKRTEIIGNIAMALANTALGITKALADYGPILGGIMAAFVGITGGIQVALMTKQLTKLAKGGEIVGPSHDNGGVNITIDGKPSYEAQGGEFMVNDKSYAANTELVKFINANPSAITASDLVGLVPGLDNVPTTVTDMGSSADDRVVDAIENIELSPVVSVVDIIDVTSDVTTVRDLAGA